MTKTEKLAEEIKKILAEKYTAEDLKTLCASSGPRGGHNARLMPGWQLSPSGAITRAANLAGCPTRNYWSGSNPTPSTAIPARICYDAEKAYIKIRDEDDLK